MQVKLNEEGGNITVSKEQGTENYLMNIDARVTVTLSKTELKLLYAVIGAQLQDNPKAGKDSLKKVLGESLVSHAAKFQDALRKMKKEDVAFAVWYAGDLRITHEILKNMSKRSADEVQEAVRETIERRIRKERSTGNAGFETQMEEYGRNAVMTLLKLVYDSETIPM